MKIYLAKLISYAFIPPISLIIIFIILANQIYADYSYTTKTLLIASTFGTILPIIVFLIFRKMGKIINDDATRKEERTVPFLIGIGLAFTALILSYFYELHPLILGLWIAYILIQIVVILTNLSWKISAHMVGIGISYATFIFLFQTDYFYVLIIPIIIGWARLTLKVHTSMQVIVGFLLGTIPTYFILLKAIKLF
ncbi:MAG: hypothetical protein KKF62_05440 [Bacteroidetes bacterium]|nr:hypothetical protein [Bacteroidota bacterium]MBU1115754.1 hypothetical protein [Bacteroidota bacterium]MBU1799458.1 hypothetical protein [Bacteroidota bacterium]